MLRIIRGMLVAGLLAAPFGATNAAPVAPLPGFDPDAGVSYFTPGSAVVGIELIDPLEPFTSFGFYYKSDPGSLFNIFDGGDLTTSAQQVSLVDFGGGGIYDLDATPGTPILEQTFAVLADDIGFFLGISSTTLYSDPSLNGGLDLFSAWQNSSDPTLWGFAFEGINPATGALEVINITLVGGLAVPAPPILLLLASGLGLMLVHNRRRRTLAHSR